MVKLEEARIYRGDIAEIIPRPQGKVHFCGLNLSATAFILSGIIRRQPETYLIYLPTPVEAEDLVRDLEFFWPEGAASGSILLLPGYEVKPFAGESPSLDLVFARLWALNALMNRRKPLLVAASAPGLLQLSLPKQALSQATEFIEQGQEVDRDGLIRHLAASGFYAVNIVQSQGDFSVRGGILDLYPPGAMRPARAEFFGDFIESLRSFKTSDQRSFEDLAEQVILPANEIIFSPGRAEKAAQALGELSLDAGWHELLWAPLKEKIASAQFFPGLESFLPLFYDRLDSVQDFAGPEVTHLVFEPERFLEAGRNHLARLETHLQKIQDEERPHLSLARLYRTPEEVLGALQQKRVIEAHELPYLGQNEAVVYQFMVETNQDLRALIESSKGSAGLLTPLAARIKVWLARGLTVILTCHTPEQARRLAELIQEYGLYPGLDLEGRGPVTRGDQNFWIVVGFLSQGFVLAPSGRAFVTEDELFGPKRRSVRRAVEEVRGIHLSSFQDLTVGDYVVHNDHGVGQYLGLVGLEVEGRLNDYLHVAYKGGDKLYVPVERFSSVGKYIGSDNRPPALDKLGGLSWERVKAKVKASIREMAEELLKLYASRQVKKGHAFSPVDSLFHEFEASFEYDETPDQMSAITEVIRDMVSDKPMDRLVCGDVGYGKTEVALRAAFKTVQDSRQAAVLVPTTVLAEQHYQTFSNRFKNYPVTVEVLSRFKSPAEQRDILARLAEGRVDLIIGTHRLLQKDVAFKNLGLLIIDEEHRFGVTHKEKLKKLRTEVDVLTLSATPIPRTLHMSLTGIRDLSVIETPPQDRLAIKTYLLKYDEPTICEAIDRELERGGQVFLVHNRVMDIEMVAGRLRRLMPLVRFGVAHGQQRERELESVMLKFLRREIDVLITTTIVESGLDFPTANTIIINNADRLGLAQIYQLRGRVGRSTAQAYAYLLVKSPENLTREARKRLRALMDFSELGAGFKIALHDLQIRGAGNLLGSAQSGQIAAVGYEMYVQLMERTVHELKGEQPESEVEPELILGLPAFIPEYYVSDTEERLVHYRSLSSLKDPAELEEAAAGFRDRYGPLPLEVENLLRAMDLKYWCKKAKVKKLELGKTGLTITFADSGPADPDKVLKLVRRQPQKTRLYPEGRLFLAAALPSGPEGLDQVKNILQDLS